MALVLLDLLSGMLQFSSCLLGHFSSVHYVKLSLVAIYYFYFILTIEFYSVQPFKSLQSKRTEPTFGKLIDIAVEESSPLIST